MQETTKRRLRITAGIIVAAVAGLRVAFFGWAGERIDEITIALLLLAAVVILVPLHRLTGFKLGDVELSWERPEVRAAARSATSTPLEAGELDGLLKGIKQRLHYFQRSRILWVDDTPDKTLAERRLLRSLGSEIVAVRTSAEGLERIDSDGDFDLLIADIQRPPTVDDDTPVDEGLRFLADVSARRSARISGRLPVVLYTFDDRSLYAPRAERFPGLSDDLARIASCQTVSQLLRASIGALEEGRLNPVKLPRGKKVSIPGEAAEVSRSNGGET